MTRYLVLITASMFTLASCNPFSRKPVTEVSRDANVNSRWRASLVTPAALAGAVQIKGAATMQPGSSSGNTDVTLSLENATPGGLHPWQLRRGSCDYDQGVVGQAQSYRAVSVGNDGRGQAATTISMTTPMSGSYFVVVGASTANSETIVACGNLAPPTS